MESRPSLIRLYISYRGSRLDRSQSLKTSPDIIDGCHGGISWMRISAGMRLRTLELY
jgi:hypothetical protein